MKSLGRRLGHCDPSGTEPPDPVRQRYRWSDDTRYSERQRFPDTQPDPLEP
jgi:hypothetical protein